MKFASSSGSFAGAIASGDLTQLEWLDLCAAELELDGVLFDARHFPRTDADYFAQLKKTAVDLGLTVAGLAFEGLLDDAAAWLEAAVALGAPLLVVQAPAASADAQPDAAHAARGPTRADRHSAQIASRRDASAVWLRMLRRA